MTDIRRAVLWFAALLLVVIAGDRVAGWAGKRLLLRSQFRYSRLYRGGMNADVVIVGDSRGVHALYAPAIEEITGMTAFNLSYNSMSTAIGEAVLMDYLDRNRPPRLVILEVTSAFTEGALTSELRTYTDFSPRLTALYAAAHPYASASGRAFQLLQLNSGFYVEALRYMRRSDQDWINRTSMPAGLRNQPKTMWLPLRPENLAALGRIVRELHRRGIEIRLVLAPYCPMPLNMNEFANVITKTAGIPIWNYGDSLCDPDDFADTIHLNERGSRVLLAMMKRDGVFGMTQHPPRF
jgi:hypothetical protein